MSGLVDTEIEWHAPRKRSALRKTTKSVSQEWLDRVSNPGPLWFRTWLRWLNRFLTQPAEYPSEDLEQWATETGAEIRGLHLQLRNLAESDSWEDLKTPEWAKVHDRLTKAQAFQSACMEALEMRTKRPRPAGNTSSPGLKPSISTAALEWDPFQNC
jgi:hypothetical protein